MGTSGDKIVLLDGMGSGSGSATNGLLSMIPGMFANLIGGNKMDPNLAAVTMRTTMMRSTIVEAAVDVADVRMGLTWVMVVEYMTIMARSMTVGWMS